MYLLRKGAYRDISHHLKAHTISNKLVSKVSAQKKGGKSYDSSNMCSNFGGKWIVPYIAIVDDTMYRVWMLHKKCVYIYIYICVHIYVCIYMCVYIYIYVCVYMYM